VPAIFFGTSALVKRYDPAESGADRVRSLCRLASDSSALIARVTPVEVASALNCKRREGRLDTAGRDHLWRLFRAHWRDQYRTVALDEAIWVDAQRFLFLYPLRAYDAIQLSSALRIAGVLADLTTDVRLCTADRAQAAAADGEGLTVELVD
jgi:uncharacterized protein